MLPSAAERPSAAELARHVRESLPPYMVPASFVVLDAFPLTAHGPVDLAALAASTASAESPRAAGEHVAPRTPLEAQIAGVWRELLGVERIGVHDNFFELGGHSLLATRAAARMYQATGFEVKLHVLFEAPTIAELAIAVAATAAADEITSEADLLALFEELDALDAETARGEPA